MKKEKLKKIISCQHNIILDLKADINELEAEANEACDIMESLVDILKVTLGEYCDIKERCDIGIERCYTDGKTTTAVVWSDGSVTKAKCGKGETFDAEKGFLACVAKRALSSKQYSTIIGSRKDFPIINSGNETPEIKSKKIPEEVLEKALKDHLNGLTYADAASKYGISRTTLVKYASKKR